MRKPQRLIQGVIFMAETRPYLYCDRPYYKTGWMLDSKRAEIKKMRLRPTFLIKLPELIQN